MFARRGVTGDKLSNLAASNTDEAAPQQSRSREHGASMLEYCFLAISIFLVCIALVKIIGEQTADNFNGPIISGAFNGN